MLEMLSRMLLKRPPAPAPAAAPDFAHAKNRRQKVRAAGMNPDYWYAVEYDRNVKAGKVVEVKFWKRSIALFRGADGALRAIDNRCAHRQLKLSLGQVEGCNLVCPYHGWCYDGDGKVVDIPHDLFGRERPSLGVQSYPVQVRYGLIWIFPGDPALASERHIPDIPELEAAPSDRWACVPIDATWNAHHSMILDNVSDFTHAHLHRKYKPFYDAKLTRCEMVGDAVHVSYDTKVGGGEITRHFIDRRQIDTNAMDLCYQYPYQWSNTDGKIKHWCFVLPIDERTSRAFFLFYFDSFKVPFLPLHFPRRVMNLIIHFANLFHIRPLLDQDGWAVEAEQEGYESNYDAPLAELSPAVNLFQQLTIRKWEEHLAKTGEKPGHAPRPSAQKQART
jgi:phenylpropionate dioxygenase-like ring-hydroxylating dioxygenase large terminal subunit